MYYKSCQNGRRSKKFVALLKISITLHYMHKKKFIKKFKKILGISKAISVFESPPTMYLTM